VLRVVGRNPGGKINRSADAFFPLASWSLPSSLLLTDQNAPAGGRRYDTRPALSVVFVKVDALRRFGGSFRKDLFQQVLALELLQALLY